MDGYQQRRPDQLRQAYLVDLSVQRLRPGRGLVGRHDLVAMLDRAVGKRVTIISAPTGGGKTSLLHAWAHWPDETAGSQSPGSGDGFSRARRGGWARGEGARPPGDVRRDSREMTVASPASGAGGAADLPHYAPIPRSALGVALNDQGYYAGRVERNLVPTIPPLPHDIWADEVLLDPNTLERSCVHLQNGDLKCLRPRTLTSRYRQGP